MSIIKSIILLSSVPIVSSISSSKISKVNSRNQSLVWSKQGLQYMAKSHRRSLAVRSAVQRVPPPSEPPSNFLNWAVGFLLTVVIPFFSNKWASLLKIKSEVETTVQRIEDITVAVERVAEEVEKVAEDIADDLPEGGSLRKAVDFVEHVAERASKDAHQLEDFINKVQEAEEKVEELVEMVHDEQIANKPPKEDEKGPIDDDQLPKYN